MEDAANNFARGRYTVGREISVRLFDVIRREIDLCHHMEGFLILHSMGGGTGSGLTSLLMEYLNAEYPKTNKLQFIVYPSPRVSFEKNLLEKSSLTPTIRLQPILSHYFSSHLS